MARRVRLWLELLLHSKPEFISALLVDEPGKAADGCPGAWVLTTSGPWALIRFSLTFVDILEINHYRDLSL